MARGRWRRSPCAGWRGRSATAGPTGSGWRSVRAPASSSTRLAIFDIQNGWQPMQSDAGGTLIVYNGEVFNHPELRAELARDGINLETTSDTEVVLRLLERDGLAALDRLNGQFAFAWWEPGPRRLTLVRDRFGIHPLHWTLLDDGTIVFGSEAKALFASGEVSASPDLGGIDDVFTTWAPRAPRTAFRGVHMLPPGQLIVWEGGRIVAERTWWKPDYSPRTEEAGDLEPIMRSSVELRLRADVPVGTYLSGGLDSSLTTALAKEASDHQLRTFSVAFKDPHYDERAHQQEVAGKLGTDHHVVDVGPEGDRRRLPRRRMARRDPAHPHRAGAAVPARQGDAGAGDHGRRDGRGRRRAVLGLRPLQGGRRAAGGDGQPRGRGGDLLRALPVLRGHRRRPRLGLGALLPGGGPGGRPAVLAPDTRRGDGGRQGVLRARRDAAHRGGGPPRGAAQLAAARVPAHGARSSRRPTSR